MSESSTHARTHARSSMSFNKKRDAWDAGLDKTPVDDVIEKYSQRNVFKDMNEYVGCVFEIRKALRESVVYSRNSAEQEARKLANASFPILGLGRGGVFIVKWRAELAAVPGFNLKEEEASKRMVVGENGITWDFKDLLIPIGIENSTGRIPSKFNFEHVYDSDDVSLNAKAEALVACGVIKRIVRILKQTMITTVEVKATSEGYETIEGSSAVIDVEEDDDPIRQQYIKFEDGGGDEIMACDCSTLGIRFVLG